MDTVLEHADRHFFDTVYTGLGVQWSRDYWIRQSVSLYLITLIGGFVMYLVFASVAYIFVFDHETKKHPKYLKNQVELEIKAASSSIPWMTLLTLPFFLGEVRGYSRLYRDPMDYGLGYLIISAALFVVFTDMLIYWFHRWLHHPLVYGTLHKPHHKWLVTTPFASHAFHPVDGVIQSLPYHFFVYLFPMQSHLYLALFIFVNFWTISIHDGLEFSKNGIINGAAHHSIHHLEFRYNYGQYFTLWDRIGGSYKAPKKEKSE